MSLIIRWFLSAVALMLVARFVPGIEFSGTWALVVTVIVLGLINALIRPLIIILTLPINFLTLGLFTLFINAFVFWLTGTIVKGFDVASFSAAFWGALVYALISMIINAVVKSD